jgi:arsenate reductase
MKIKVLFVCVQNSARSQMAEAWLRRLGGDHFEVKSAGLEPGRLHPLAVAVMGEVGIDLASNQTRSVFDLFKSGELFHYVITVCDEASAEKCPIFGGVTRRLHWSFPDPAQVAGTDAERLAQFRAVRDAIRAQVAAWCEQLLGAAARGSA